jgi:NADH dehydrogenase
MPPGSQLSMNSSLRRACIGILSGAAAGVVLLATLRYGLLSLILGVAIGAAYSVAVPPTRGAYADQLMTGGSLGVPLWGLISVIAMPLLSGQMPEWNADQMRQHFPALIGWVVYGAVLGIIHQGLDDITKHFVGPELLPKASSVPVRKRIVILGGGFAGMRAAKCLEEKLRGDFSIGLTLVNETNALLFTPMLAEVAGSSLEPSHISTPLRSTLRRTEFIRGVVADVDLEKRLVILRGDAGARGVPPPREVPYDHLIFALGSISNYLGMPNIEKFAFNFKSLLDAIRIRNHVIEMFERADLESDPSVRSSFLTFVVAGGGFAGVELAGALNDFAHGILADYPRLRPGELKVVLVHSRDRVLPELSESLARYAQEKMQFRGVTFRLNTRILDAHPGVVLLSEGEIHAETLVWTARTSPSPIDLAPQECAPRGIIWIHIWTIVRPACHKPWRGTDLGFGFLPLALDTHRRRVLPFPGDQWTLYDDDPGCPRTLPRTRSLHTMLWKCRSEPDWVFGGHCVRLSRIGNLPGAAP